MSKSSTVSSRPASQAKSAGGHAHNSRFTITDPLQKLVPFSTPLLSIRRLHMPSRRTGNCDDVQLALKRSYSLNVKTRRTVASASSSHVCSSDFCKSSGLISNNSSTSFGDITQKVGSRQWISATSKVLSRRSRLECLLLSENVHELDMSVDSDSVIATGKRDFFQLTYVNFICHRINIVGGLAQLVTSLVASTKLINTGPG